LVSVKVSRPPSVCMEAPRLRVVNAEQSRGISIVLYAHVIVS
jgi:hypothetical protein